MTLGAVSRGTCSILLCTEESEFVSVLVPLSDPLGRDVGLLVPLSSVASKLGWGERARVAGRWVALI